MGAAAGNAHQYRGLAALCVHTIYTRSALQIHPIASPRPAGFRVHKKCLHSRLNASTLIPMGSAVQPSKRERTMNTYEVANKASGHSFGFYPANASSGAIEACCQEAGYSSVEAAEGVMGHASDLVAQRVAIIDASAFADHDDSLTAAAEDYASKHGLSGWDLSPRWEHGAQDSLRDTIILTIPE